MTKSGKHCGKRKNCTFCAISSFVTMFSKSCLLQRLSESVYMRERLKSIKTKYGKSLIVKVQLLNWVEYIVAKVGIVHYKHKMKQLLREDPWLTHWEFFQGGCFYFLPNIVIITLHTSNRSAADYLENIETLHKWKNNFLEWLIALWQMESWLIYIWAVSPLATMFKNTSKCNQ